MNQQVRTLLCVSFWICASAIAPAAEWSELKIGYQGIGKVGKWIPLSASVDGVEAGQAVKLKAEFTDPRGDTCVQTVASGSADSSGRVALNGFFSIGRLEGTGVISVTADNAAICRQVISHGESPSPDLDAEVQTTIQILRVNVPLLLTIGEVAGVPELLRNTALFSDSVLQGVQVANASDMPANIRGLDCIDKILLASDFTMNAQQVAAIRQWVRTGGSLFFSLGGNVSEVVKTDFGQWVTGYFEFEDESRPIRELSAMQSFVSGGSRLETGRRTVAMAISRSAQNQADVDSLIGPLIATQSIGAGTATFIAVDLNERPVNNWNSLPQFYEVLMFGEKLSKQTGTKSRSSRISQSGVSDLSTQMMATVDAVPPSGKWSTWSILAMMIGWLILIGPLDYLLVTRVLKKPHFTWLTFPLFICLGVFALVKGLGSANDNTLNQLHLVDVANTESGSSVHTRSWMSLSSSETARTDLEATANLIADSDGETSLFWSGRVEDVYGGMYRSGGIGLGRQSYSHDTSTAASLQGLPLLTDGSRQLVAESYSTPDAPLIESSLEAFGYGLLRGSFKHSLPAAIEDFIVIHGNRVYRTDQTDGKISLAPGSDWEARGNKVSATDLKAYLNGSRIIKSDQPNLKSSTQTQTAYNSKSDDPVYILTMATFYDVAGGSKYVGLSQEYLRNAELSDTIRLNHAVLIGTTRTPATSLSVDGTEMTAATTNTVVRLLLPINRRPVDTSRPSKEQIEMLIDDSNGTATNNKLP